MSDAGSIVATAPPLYPAAYFSASPTFHKWVKLTAKDIHALRRVRGFESQHIYFHLNHPIRYVYVIGPVVAVDFISERFTILTVDDGSNRTIDVKVQHVQPSSTASNSAGRERAAGPAWQSQHNELGDLVSDDDDNAHTSRHAASKAAHLPRRAHALVPSRLDTQVPGLAHVSVNYRRTLEFTEDVLGAQSTSVSRRTVPVDVGTVIKAKGSLETYRSAFQLTLLRMFVVHRLDEEVTAWEEYAKFCEEVLCEPWKLTQTQMDDLDERERQHQRKMRERERLEQEARVKWRRRQERRDQKRKLQEQKDEVWRRQEAEELDGLALDMPEWKRRRKAIALKASANGP